MSLSMSRSTLSEGTDYEGEFGDYVEFFGTFGELEDGFGSLCAAFVHELERFFGAGFGAIENHFQSGLAERFEGIVGELHHRVGTCFRPPAEVEPGDFTGDFVGTFFGDEEIIVVKFDGTDFIFIFKIFEMVVYKLGFPAEPFAVVEAGDCTETAEERAADAGKIADGSGTEIGFPEAEILFHVQSVIGKQRDFVRVYVVMAFVVDYVAVAAV